MAPHYAAGVLFVTFVDHRGSRPLFLVGRESRCGLWSDWAGKAERVDRQCPLATAAREAYEESYGQVVSVPALTARLQRGRCVRLLSRTQNGSLFHFFVVEIPFLPEFVDRFRASLSFLRARLPTERTSPGTTSEKSAARALVEKVDARWVTPRQLADLPKREVFSATLGQHADTLARLTDAAAFRAEASANAAADVWCLR